MELCKKDMDYVAKQEAEALKDVKKTPNMKLPLHFYSVFDKVPRGCSACPLLQFPVHVEPLLHADYLDPATFRWLPIKCCPAAAKPPLYTPLPHRPLTPYPLPPPLCR
jgi:hypothetical protein